MVLHEQCGTGCYLNSLELLHPSSLGRRWLVGRLRIDLVGALGPYDAVCIFWVLDELLSRISARLRGWSNVFYLTAERSIPAFNFIVLACVMGLLC